jgi:hypothetical protein
MKKKGGYAAHGNGFLSDAWGHVKNVAKKVHDVAKKRRVISGALKEHFGKDSALAKFAHNNGYGAHRRGRGGSRSRSRGHGQGGGQSGAGPAQPFPYNRAGPSVVNLKRLQAV